MVTQSWDALKSSMDQVDLAVGNAAGYSVEMRDGTQGRGVYIELRTGEWAPWRPSLDWDDAWQAFAMLLAENDEFIVRLMNVLPESMVDKHGRANIRRLIQHLVGRGPTVLCQAIIGLGN